MSRIIFNAIVLLLFTFQISTAQPLSGSYTINSAVVTGGTNFQTFNDFATAINLNGISASVNVDVTIGSGPYVEKVLFENVTGTSATATVTLNGNGETITAVTDSANRYIVRLKSVSYFTVTNLHVVRDTTSISGFYGIHILNTGNNINITNCTVDIPSTSSTLAGGIIASGSPTSILFTGDFHNINITGNTTTGGGYGASVFGLLSNLASGINISHNTFYDFHSNGVYLRETDSAVISHNVFDKRTSQVSSANAIQLAQAANVNGRIFNNEIKVSQTNNGSLILRGIYLFNGLGHKVYNNVIHEIKLVSGDFTAIEVRSEATSPEISFNTISIDTTATTTSEIFGFAESLSNTNSILKNNIINITQPGPNKAALALATGSILSTAIISDNNVVWIQNGGNFALMTSTTPVPYLSLTDWQTVSTQDLNSFSADPFFSTPTTPIPTNLVFNNAGVAIPGITTDFNGATRGTPPDIGAYEFGSVGINATETWSNLMIYPNPAANILNIKLWDKGLNHFETMIYDITGKIVQRNYISENNFSDTYQLNIENLNPGNYILRITSDTKITQGKFSHY